MIKLKDQVLIEEEEKEKKSIQIPTDIKTFYHELYNPSTKPIA